MAPYRDFDPADPKWLADTSDAQAGDLMSSATPSRWVDCRQAIVACKLPPGISRLVYEVVHRTRLSHPEKLDVVNELCSQFANGLKDGSPPERLIQAYGSPAKAATLIRRTKLRSRPFWKKFVRRLGQSLVVLFVLVVLTYGFLVARFYSASPSIARNYWLETNATRQVAESDRAWPIYREAFADLGKQDREFITQHFRDPIGSPTWPELVGVIQRHPKALTLARQAAQMPKLGQFLGDIEDQKPPFADEPDSERSSEPQFASDNQPMVYARLFGAQALKVIAEMLSVDTRRAIEAGDNATAFADIKALLRVSTHNIQPACSLVEQKCALSAFELALETIGFALWESPNCCTGSEWREVAELIESLWGGDIKLDFAADRKQFDDTLQRFYTDDGQGDGRVAPAAFEAGDSDERRVLDKVTLPAISVLLGGRRQNREYYNNWLNEFIAAHEGPAWRWNPDVIIDTQTRFQDSVATRRQQLSYWLAGVMVPETGAIFGSVERATQMRNATQVAIALVLWHRREAEWPANLDVLVPDLLAAVPADRLDGKPLRYVVREGQPLVYSIGKDRDDDRGESAFEQSTDFKLNPKEWSEPAKDLEILSDNGDWILWPIPPTAEEAYRAKELLAEPESETEAVPEPFQDSEQTSDPE